MTAVPQSRAHTGAVIFSAGVRPFSDLGRRSDPALAWHLCRGARSADLAYAVHLARS
jgi:hypothetical protein